MSHEVCNEIQEWVEEQVQQPVEKWIDQEVQKCAERDCDWWCACCNKWFCWIETIVVKVVEWVLVTVGKWVTHTVCEIVADVVDLVVNVVEGLVNIIVGIFTWNWARVWDGLVQLVDGIVAFIFAMIRIAFLGDTIWYFWTEYEKWRLRNYVRDLLEKKYRGDQLAAIKDALGVDYGTFGLRIRARAIRTFVRSDFHSNAAAPPDLIVWHNNPATGINIRKLAGYDWDAFFGRFRPEVVADSGSISEVDVQAYINSNGFIDPGFSIFCMDEGTLDTKLSTASDKARAIGVLPRWHKETIQVKAPGDVRQTGQTTAGANLAEVSFLNRVIGRTLNSVNPQGAINDLCTLPTVGIFGYDDGTKTNGLTQALAKVPCVDSNSLPPGPSDDSGLTHIDRLPDFVFRYVLVHEMGHYFGLCHVDGLDRIMFAPRSQSWWSWWLLPDYLYLSGGPSFVLDEGKRVWDYIVANFPPECLMSRAE